MAYSRGFLLTEIFPKNAVGFEIGIFRGAFANSLVNKIHPKEYHMIDPWEYRSGWKRYDYNGKLLLSQDDVEWMVEDIRKRFDKPGIKIHRAYSYDVVNEFADGYFDFGYVDGNHNYHAVLQDMRLFYPKIKDGGVMAGDDWNIKGGRVKKAVRTFTAEVGVKFNVRFGQFWFYKGGETNYNRNG